MPSLPRIVWTFWLQGWGVAPETAQACVVSWRRLNPGWDVRAIDESTLPAFLAPSVIERLTATRKEPEALSDQIRIELLHAHGGVWVDATAMCAKPLDEWLPQRMRSGFFAFERPGPDRMIASWFLAASRPSYIASKWRDSAAEYWADRNERDNYFWFHQLFAQLYAQDETFRCDWDLTPALPARHEFHFSPNDTRLTARATAAHIDALSAPPSPVFKLTHKLSQTVEGNSLMEVLRAFGRGEPTR